MMLYLIIGIVLGAAFHEFWHDLFHKAKNKISDWTSEQKKGDGDVVEGEVVQPEQSESHDKSQPASS